jgi:molybdenum cofactor biosynthesis enzyme MoaA
LTTWIARAEFQYRISFAGLGRITVSLDSLDEDVFAGMTGGRGSVAFGSRGAGFDMAEADS